MRPAAVRIESSSSSWVVEPSARAEIVRVETTIGSTPMRPSDARATALTILLRSTGSSAPLRFFTRMVVVVSTAVSVPSVSVPPTADSRSSVIAIESPSSRVEITKRAHRWLSTSPPSRPADDDRVCKYTWVITCSSRGSFHNRRNPQHSRENRGYPQTSLLPHDRHGAVLAPLSPPCV